MSHDATVDVATENRTTRDLVKAAVSGWLGTALEFMDFQLYSLGAALVFTHIFFDDADPAMGVILAMGTYGAGYAARLVGAIYFGHLGDRIGRRQVLFITITLMGLCTTLIGVLPTYAQVGVWAPILLVALRLVQGFGAGAEISGAGTMLAEYAPKGRRGILAALVALGTNCGTLAATGIWAIVIAAFDEETLLSWGWRIPFLLSFVVMIFAVWIRAHLKETPVFETKNDDGEAVDIKAAEAAARQAALAGSNSNERFMTKAFWVALGLRFGQGGNSGLLQTFLASYLITYLAVEKAITTNMIMISSVVGFAMVPFIGWLSDRVGRRPLYMVLNAAAVILCFPLLHWMVTGLTPSTITISFIIIHNISVLGVFALENITLAEIFGLRNRFMKMAAAKEVAGLIASGVVPVIAAAFCKATNSWWPIAAMIMAFSAIGFIAALVGPEVKDRDLTIMEDAA